MIFTVFFGSNLYSIPSGAVCKIQGTKPDGKGFSYFASSVSGSTVVCNVTEQMTASHGRFSCELVLQSGQNRIGTCNMIFDVEQAALSDGTDISKTEIPAIVDIANDQLQEIKINAANAKASEVNAKSSEQNAANSAAAAKLSENTSKAIQNDVTNKLKTVANIQKIGRASCRERV